MTNEEEPVKIHTYNILSSMPIRPFVHWQYKMSDVIHPDECVPSADGATSVSAGIEYSDCRAADSFNACEFVNGPRGRAAGPAQHESHVDLILFSDSLVV